MRMFKKTSLLTHPTLAHRDALFPKQGRSRESTGGVTFSPTHPELLTQFCPDGLR